MSWNRAKTRQAILALLADGPKTYAELKLNLPPFHYPGRLQRTVQKMVLDHDIVATVEPGPYPNEVRYRLPRRHSAQPSGDARGVDT